jgi:hypothetical protein
MKIIFDIHQYTMNITKEITDAKVQTKMYVFCEIGDSTMLLDCSDSAMSITTAR